MGFHLMGTTPGRRQTGETLEDQLSGRRSPTQFGRAMAELGIQLGPAHFLARIVDERPRVRAEFERKRGRDRPNGLLHGRKIVTYDK